MAVRLPLKQTHVPRLRPIWRSNPRPAKLDSVL